MYLGVASYPGTRAHPGDPASNLPDPNEMPPRSVEINGLRIGEYLTPFALSALDIGGKPDATIGDKPRPRDDGLFFGRDDLTGRVITLEGSIDAANYLTASRAWDSLSQTWDSTDTRRSSGRVVSLRLRLQDGATRRVYGRPRRLDAKDDPGFKLMDRGRLDFVSDFQCVDQYFYGDDEKTNTVGIVTGTSSGLVEPLIEPLGTHTASSANPAEVVVAGSAAAPFRAVIKGPIVNPVVDVVGHFFLQLQMTINYDQYVTIDTTPWNSSVRLNDTYTVSGALTATSQRLTKARLPLGYQQVVLRGQSDSGTAALTVSWRDTYYTA